MYFMQRKLLIPSFLFLLIIIIDLVSYNSRSLENSEVQISSYVEDVLEAHRNFIFQSDLINLFERDSLDNQALGRLKRLERQFQDAGIQLRLYENDKLLYWSNFQSQDSVCNIYNNDGYELHICKALTNASGEILLDVKRKSILAKKRGSNYVQLDNELVNKLTQKDSVNLDRHASTNRTFLIFYLLSFLLLILSSLHNKNFWGVVIALVLRIIFRISGGMDRLGGLVLSENLFTNFNYSGFELLLDSILIVGILSAILQTKNFSNRSNNSQVYLDGGFFLLLTLSHIRLIQLLTFSDKVFNDFNNLASPDKIGHSGSCLNSHHSNRHFHFWTALF